MPPPLRLWRLRHHTVVFATSARPSTLLWLTPDTARDFDIPYDIRNEVETTFWEEAQPAAPIASEPYHTPQEKPVQKPQTGTPLSSIYPNNNGSGFDPADISRMLSSEPRRR